MCVTRTNTQKDKGQKNKKTKGNQWAYSLSNRNLIKTGVRHKAQDGK